MIIKNHDIQDIGKFLLELTLKGKQSRMRSRFINLLQEHLNQVTDERQQLLDDYVKKDENGEPIMEEVDGQISYKVGNPHEYQRELAVLMSEDFIIEETPKVMDMLTTIQEIVFGLEDMEMSGQEAMIYNNLYELVEDIGEEVES